MIRRCSSYAIYFTTIQCLINQTILSFYIILSLQCVNVFCDNWTPYDLLDYAYLWKRYSSSIYYLLYTIIMPTWEGNKTKCVCFSGVFVWLVNLITSTMRNTNTNRKHFFFVLPMILRLEPSTNERLIWQKVTLLFRRLKNQARPPAGTQLLYANSYWKCSTKKTASN